MSNRRSTRLNRASAEPSQPTEAALQRSRDRVESPYASARKTRSKAKAVRNATSTQLESFQSATVKTQSQNASKITTASRVITASTPTSAVTTVSKRTTRATRAAAADSALRVPTSTEKKRKRTTRGQTASATPEPAQSDLKQDDESDEQQLGAFFSKSEPTISSSTTQTTPRKSSPITLSAQIAVYEDENNVLRDEILQLHVRIRQLETTNASLTKENTLLRDQLMYPPTSPQLLSGLSTPKLSQSHSQSIMPSNVSPRARLDHPSQYPLSILSQPSYPPSGALQTGQVSTNNLHSEFDDDLMHVEESSPARPTFVNGSESAIALLNKIENAAKETARIEPSTHDNRENNSDDDVAMENSPRQINDHGRTLLNATPARLMATPSGFFTRSFSALKSIFSTPTPKAPAPEMAPSPTPSKALPAPNSFTESLSVPPTPIGERIKTPAKKKKGNHMLKTLLKGVEHHDRARAEEWAKQVLPALKNDRAFRQKRKRLETPVLVKDLNHFPSSKPWETGFGDPLAELDDEEVVPVWAVYLDIMAEAEEPQTKKNKTNHAATTDDDDMLSINEQFAASQGASPSPMLQDSRGQSASLLDLHPRRSIEPSPMFATPISHQQGGNIFRELQGHDTAAQIRANEREILQEATNKTVHASSTVGASFSVPDDSDDEDSTIVSETSGSEESSAWTQAPPPAPVPAHAALPGASMDASMDAPAVATNQQPVDEVERQRQKLMKHTPAKPSRLREATYPSPSLISDAGNESILAGTPIQFASSVSHMFDDIPAAESIELDVEMQADLDALVNSEEYKQQLAANPWPAPTLVYESDEESLSSD